MGFVLTDQQIAAMSPPERRELIVRLTRPLEQVDDPDDLRRRRRLRIVVAGVAAVLLVPWVFYLALSLPAEHRIRNWDVLWVGFDVVEMTLLALTFWLSYRRRLMALLAGFATGVVLLCDAWFDILTSAPGDLWQAILAAVLIEVPLALLLISGAVRAVRVVPALFWFADPGASAWSVRLPISRLRTRRTGV
jgi:hypothetical protein